MKENGIKKHGCYMDAYQKEIDDELKRRRHLSAKPVHTPYVPDWKPSEPFKPFKPRHMFNRVTESSEQEESGFHFTISKLNCNFSPAISKFSVSLK